MLAFKLVGAPVAETDPLHRLLFLRAGGSAQKEPARSAVTPPEIDIDDVEVDQQFCDYWEMEVSRADMDLEGRSLNSVTKYPLCPFRTFRDKTRVRVYLRTYHTRERWFCASSLPNSRVAEAQLHIAKALYNQKHDAISTT